MKRSIILEGAPWHVNKTIRDAISDIHAAHGDKVTAKISEPIEPPAARFSKVAVSVGRTVNIGNYESVRAEIMLEAEHMPGEGDQITELRKRLNIRACKELDATVTNLVNLYRS